MRINHKGLVSAMVGVGLLVLSGSVYADQVLDCQLNKLKAAADRAKCISKQRSQQVMANSYDLASCEAQFDAAIAAAGGFCRYVDNGDGTFSDLDTLLMWEEKQPGTSATRDIRGVGTCLHCVNDRYMWKTAMSEWLSAINGRTNSNVGQTGFAGYEDWRLPTIQELTGLANVRTYPGPTGEQVGGNYWSASTAGFNAGGAWYFGFFSGVVGTTSKDDPDNVLMVRAVRAGR